MQQALLRRACLPRPLLPSRLLACPLRPPVGSPAARPADAPVAQMTACASPIAAASDLQRRGRIRIRRHWDMHDSGGWGGGQGRAKHACCVSAVRCTALRKKAAARTCNRPRGHNTPHHPAAAAAGSWSSRSSWASWATWLAAALPNLLTWRLTGRLPSRPRCRRLRRSPALRPSWGPGPGAGGGAGGRERGRGQGGEQGQGGRGWANTKGRTPVQAMLAATQSLTSHKA